MDTSASRYFSMEIKTFTPLVLTHRPANLTTLPIRSLCERSSSLDAGRNSTAVYVIGSLQEPINASISSTPSGRSSRHELSICALPTEELRGCPTLLADRILGSPLAETCEDDPLGAQALPGGCCLALALN